MRTVGVKARCQRGTCRGTMLRNECLACGWSQSWAHEAAQTQRLVAEGVMRVNGNDGKRGRERKQPITYWAEQMRLWREGDDA